MFMMLGTPLLTLASQPRIAVVVAQPQQPVNRLLDHLLARFDAASE